MSLIETGAMILPGPKFGGKWDAVMRDCERAFLIVKSGQRWSRRCDFADEGDATAAIAYVDAAEVIAVARYTLEIVPGLVGGRTVSLVNVTVKNRSGKERTIRGDRFIRQYVEVSPP